MVQPSLSQSVRPLAWLKPSPFGHVPPQACHLLHYWYLGENWVPLVCQHPSHQCFGGLTGKLAMKARASYLGKPFRGVSVLRENKCPLWNLNQCKSEWRSPLITQLKKNDLRVPRDVYTWSRNPDSLQKDTWTSRVKDAYEQQFFQPPENWLINSCAGHKATFPWVTILYVGGAGQAVFTIFKRGVLKHFF